MSRSLHDTYTTHLHPSRLHKALDGGEGEGGTGRLACSLFHSPLLPPSLRFILLKMCRRQAEPFRPAQPHFPRPASAFAPYAAVFWRGSANLERQGPPENLSSHDRPTCSRLPCRIVAWFLLANPLLRPDPEMLEGAAGFPNLLSPGRWSQPLSPHLCG